MSLRSSLLVFLVGCVPVYDPIVICHNANCDGSGLHDDDSIEGLRASLALTFRGTPAFDGVEIDTFLHFNETTQTSRCLFAHDEDAENPNTPNDAALLVAKHLQQPQPMWNGERFYLKVEMKPTVSGSDKFHTAKQTIQHVNCVLDMIEVATRDSTWPVTVIIDSTSECLHNDFKDLRAEGPPITNPLVTIEHSGPIVPVRYCQDNELDVRTFFVRDWRDSEIEVIRPAMVWMDARSENTETLKIIRHIRPEYVTTSKLPFVRGWIEGYR